MWPDSQLKKKKKLLYLRCGKQIVEKQEWEQEDALEVFTAIQVKHDRD